MSQTNWFQKLKPQYPDEVISEFDSTASFISSECCLSHFDDHLNDINSATVDATQKKNASDSSDGDFEFVNEEESLAAMDTNGHHSSEEDSNRTISVSEEAESRDEFKQMNNKVTANWNMMEVGEKRKRLR